MEHGEHVIAAMRNAGLDRLDERGLMPLDEARALVRAATEFRKGGGRMIRGSWVLDSDRLWAALMSLADADELVREASRIRWFFHPRGRDNVAPLERYGEAILPWLTTFILPNGVLIDVPWCVTACLGAIASREVFERMWSIRDVAGTPDGEGPGPFAADTVGDVEIDRDALAAQTFAEPSKAADGALVDWVFAQPAIAFPELALRAEAGDPRGLHVLRGLAGVDPEDAFAHASRALGEARARAAFARAAAPTEIDADAILAMLDNSTSHGWPDLFGEPCYHAMRLVAARERGGGGWGLAFERIEGASQDTLARGVYVMGSRVAPGPRTDEGDVGVFEDEEEEAPEGAAIVVGPAGPITVDRALIEQLDLRPDLATGPEEEPTRFAVLVRAYVALHLSTLWAPVEQIVQHLCLGDDPEIIVVSAAFEHTVGPYGIDDYPPRWRVWPRASATYQSLARALIARDAAHFEPGESNLDFRLHALSEV